MLNTSTLDLPGRPRQARSAGMGGLLSASGVLPDAGPVVPATRSSGWKDKAGPGKGRYGRRSPRGASCT